MPLGPERAALRRGLLRWFAGHKRNLPWRRTRDPYAIWVAEIMLQQTRVAAVLEHYREFLRKFPTVEALAEARLSAVLAAWSGLGYYRRARNLHAAAQGVVRDFGGRLPVTEAEWGALPGVGRYTAAAVASTAFGRPCAVVDGNVERVLNRLLAQQLSRPQLWQMAEQLLSRRHPGDFNQAMMELGATVCLPASPRCESCPLRRWCSTRGELPGRPPGARLKRRICHVLAVVDGRVFLEQRPASASLMPAMWELPATEPSRVSSQESMALRHAITNTDYLVTVVRGPAPNAGRGRWISFSRLRQLPLTGLARKVLRRAGII
jgi:A/G-specific adenine glycosylase